jgi:hypothetical protein
MTSPSPFPVLRWLRASPPVGRQTQFPFLGREEVIKRTDKMSVTPIKGEEISFYRKAIGFKVKKKGRRGMKG